MEEGAYVGQSPRMCRLSHATVAANGCKHLHHSESAPIDSGAPFVLNDVGSLQEVHAVAHAAALARIASGDASGQVSHMQVPP